MANKRIKDLATTKYKGFMALDDADGTGKMDVATIFNNFAPEFVQNATTTTEGLPYMHNGSLYIAKVSGYQGAWDDSKFTAFSVMDASKLRAVSAPYTPGHLRWGNLVITDSGWSNIGDNRVQNRIALNLENAIKLKAGECVVVDTSKLPSPYSFYWGYKKTSDSSYTHLGWTTTNYYIAPYDCEVILLLSFPEVEALDETEILTIADSILISSSAVSRQPHPLIKYADIASYALRIGTYDYYSYKMHYASNDNRMTPAENQFVYLKTGDKICAEGCRIYLNYFGNVVTSVMKQLSSVSWTNKEVVVDSDGFYTFIIDTNGNIGSVDGKLLYIEREGIKYRAVGSLIPSDGDALGIPIDTSILHLGFNAIFSNDAAPIISRNARRFCTFPSSPISVKKGDVLVVNLDSDKTTGVYIQHDSTTGTRTTRSWNYTSYAAPSDGVVHLLVEIKESVDASEYYGIMNNAFRLMQRASICNRSMVAKDPKVKFNKFQELFIANKEGIAHRGFESEAPENTLPAYRLAAEKGFRFVECDVQYTSDGVAVLCHDSTIDRTSDGTGTLSSFTLAQLRELDFGSWKGEEFTGTPIPTLEDFLKCCNSLGLIAVIDFSNTGTPSHARMSAMLELIVACGMAGRCIFLAARGGFISLLAEVFAYTNDFVAAVSFLSDNLTDFTSEYIQRLKEFAAKGYPVFISTSYDHISQNLQDFCKNNNILVNAYTVQSTSALDALVGIGCIRWVSSGYYLAQKYYKEKELAKACTEL